MGQRDDSSSHLTDPIRSLIHFGETSSAPVCALGHLPRAREGLTGERPRLFRRGCRPRQHDGAEHDP